MFFIICTGVSLFLVYIPCFYFHVRSLKYLRRNLWASDNRILLVITAINTVTEKPVIATPRDVPAAGGCSKSTATIRNTEIPTARAYTKIEENSLLCGIKTTSEPDIKPITCPPITLLGMAEMFLGMVNTIKAVAPIDAITTAFSMLRTSSTIAKVQAAKKLWYI